MATHKLNLLILLLIIIGLGGCGQKYPLPAEDPSKDIIGKWEKIAEGPDEDRIVPVETDGSYMEFLPNGEHKGYWADAKYTYQIDSVFLYLYADNPDNNFIYEYTFINRDMLKLKYVQGNTAARMGSPEIFIYQRIK